MNYKSQAPSAEDKTRYIGQFFSRCAGALALTTFPDGTKFRESEFLTRARALGFDISASRLDEIIYPSPEAKVEVKLSEVMAFAEVFKVHPKAFIADYYQGARSVSEHIEEFAPDNSTRRSLHDEESEEHQAPPEVILFDAFVDSLKPSNCLAYARQVWNRFAPLK